MCFNLSRKHSTAKCVIVPSYGRCNYNFISFFSRPCSYLILQLCIESVSPTHCLIYHRSELEHMYQTTKQVPVVLFPRTSSGATQIRESGAIYLQIGRRMPSSPRFPETR